MTFGLIVLFAMRVNTVDRYVLAPMASARDFVGGNDYQGD